LSAQSAEDLFFELALADLTRAAELFQPVFAQTDGVDGWVIVGGLALAGP
jgi:transaldolase